MALVRVAKAAEIPAGTIRGFDVGGTQIAVANFGGKFYAISGTCLHRGGPLAEGTLDGTIVTCPWHGWEFDVTTGRNTLNPDAVVGCFPVELQGDEVFVDAGSDRARTSLSV